MNQSLPGELDADVRALMDAAEPGIEPPHDVKQRVAQRLVLSVTGLAGAPHSAPIEKGAGGGPGLTRLVARGVGFGSGHTLAGFVLGAIVGAGALATLRGPAPSRIVYVERPPTPAAQASTEAPGPVAPAAEKGANEALPLRAISSSAPSGSNTSSTTGHGVGIEAEQALLDLARRAIVEGRSADALRAAGEHARRFPSGMLVEEREALAINALVTSSRPQEARNRADRFLLRYPNSLLRPAVEAAVSTIP